MPPVYKSFPTGPWIRGINAAVDPYSTPKGAAARLSNMYLRRRGALHTIDGSLIISAAGGIIQPTNQGAILALFLFQPTGINPYYVDIQLDALHHLGAPTGLAVADGGAGGSLGAATYFYVITATDAYGGETTASSEVNIVNPGSHKNSLTWNPVNNATGYNVYRSTSTGTETLLTSVTATSFIDDGSIGLLGPYTLSSSSRTTIGGAPPTLLYSFTTSVPNAFKVGNTISTTGITPSDLNITITISVIVSPTTFQCTARTTIFKPPETGTGGSVSGSGPGSSITPPVSDTTQAVVLRVLPISQVSYDESSVVAIFPSSQGTVLVNPPGSSGGGGGTGGGGVGPGGGGGPVSGGGGIGTIT